MNRHEGRNWRRWRWQGGIQVGCARTFAELMVVFRVLTITLRERSAPSVEVGFAQASRQQNPRTLKPLVANCWNTPRQRASLPKFRCCFAIAGLLKRET